MQALSAPVLYGLLTAVSRRMTRRRCGFVGQRTSARRWHGRGRRVRLGRPWPAAFGSGRMRGRIVRVAGCHAHRRTSEVGSLAAGCGDEGVISPLPKRPDFGVFFDTKRDDFFDLPVEAGRPLRRRPLTASDGSAGSGACAPGLPAALLIAIARNAASATGSSDSGPSVSWSGSVR